MALQEGETFAGDFRVVRPLAEGGMGAVYVVEQLSTGSQRALKVMHGALFNDARLRERFAQEARIGARIDSEHVVQVVAAGVDAPTGMPWLAMELLRGETLAEALVRKGALSPVEMREIFSQLFHALSAAHAAGIVHRDLKPENIFLAESRRQGVAFTTKILDFGIAKLVAEVTTKATAAVGTPLWMSPEQTESNAQIRPAADVWAVGLIAFYALTGCFYWRAANREESSTYMLLREVLTDPIVPAGERAAEFGRADLLPAGFDGWFARCLSRAIEGRFVDATECHRALDVVLGSAGNPASFVAASATVSRAMGSGAVTPASIAMAATALPPAATGARVAVAPPANTTSPSVSATPMPPIPPPPTMPKGPGIDAPTKGRALLIGAVAGMGLAAIVGAAIVLGRGRDERSTKHKAAASNASPASSDDDDEPKSGAPTDDDDEEKSPKKKATSSASSGAADPDSTKPAAIASTSAAPIPIAAPRAPTSPTSPVATAAPTASAAPSSTPPPSTPSSIDALKASTAVTGSTFNALAARSTLDGLSWSKCKGSHGTVTLSLTFSPSGRVTSASVVSATVDSTTSTCAARVAKSARSAPFTGDPQTISYVKSF